MLLTQTQRRGNKRTSWMHLKHNCVEINLRLTKLSAQKQAAMIHVAGTGSCCQNVFVKQKQKLLLTASTIQWYWGHLTDCTTFSCLWVVVWQEYCDFTAEEYPGDPQTHSPQDCHSLLSNLHTTADTWNFCCYYSFQSCDSFTFSTSHIEDRMTTAYWERFCT